MSTALFKAFITPYLTVQKRSLLSLPCIFFIAISRSTLIFLFFFSRTCLHPKRLLIWFSAQLWTLLYFFYQLCFPFVANPCSPSYSSPCSDYSRWKKTSTRERVREKGKEEGSGTLLAIWQDRKVKPKKKGNVSTFLFFFLLFRRYFHLLTAAHEPFPFLGRGGTSLFPFPPITKTKSKKKKTNKVENIKAYPRDTTTTPTSPTNHHLPCMLIELPRKRAHPYKRSRPLVGVQSQNIISAIKERDGREHRSFIHSFTVHALQVFISCCRMFSCMLRPSDGKQLFFTISMTPCRYALKV